MSAEGLIENFMSGSYDPSLEQLREMKMLTEKTNFNVQPFMKMTKGFNTIRKPEDLDNIGKHKNDFRNAGHKTLKSLDEDIFNGKGGVSDIPIDAQQLPTDKVQGEKYLKRIFNYINNKVKSFKWSDVRAAFHNSYQVIVKILALSGIVGVGATIGSAAGVVGAAAGAGIAVIIAIIITVISMQNAVSKTEDSDEGIRIDFRGAYKNTIDGFKKMFHPSRLDKKEKGLAKGASFMVALTLFARMYMTQISNFTSRVGGHLGQALSVLANIFAGTFNAISNVAGRNVDQVGRGLRKGGVNVNMPKFGKFMTKPRQMRRAGSHHGANAGVMIAKYIVPIIAASVVIYLFSELVDKFNIGKLTKQRQDDDEQGFEGAI